MTKNKDATRYYSDRQEKSVAKVINGEQTSNSGAGRFRKGDVINQRASLLCECKCVMSEKSSISIKKEWIDNITKKCLQIIYSNQDSLNRIKQLNDRLIIITEEHSIYINNKVFNH